MTLANYAPLSVVRSSNNTCEGATAATTGHQSGRILRAEEPPDDDTGAEIHNNDDDNNSTNKKSGIRGNHGAGDLLLSNEVASAAADKDGNGRPRSSGSIRYNYQDEETKSSHNSNNNNYRNISYDTFPECWFEDVVTGIPLRWQLFAGILYDLVKGKGKSFSLLQKGKDDNNSQQQQQQHNRRNDDNPHFLPWQVRVHFTCYPHDRILALDDGGGIGIGHSGVQQQQHPTQNNTGDDSNILINHNNDAHRQIDALIARTYRNSLKQALFLQYGTSRTAMSINKQSHEQLWDAIQTCNYEKYCEINSRLQRGMVCRSVSASSTITTTTTSSLLSLTIGEKQKERDDDDNIPQLIPVRLMLNDLPAIQHPTPHQRKKDSNSMDSNNCRRQTIEERMVTYQTPSFTTLGSFLADNLPHHFEIDSNKGTVRRKCAEDENDTFVCYCIQGIQPSFECAMVDLWRCLSHPDHFLYVIVVTE